MKIFLILLICSLGGSCTMGKENAFELFDAYKKDPIYIKWKEIYGIIQRHEPFDKNLISLALLNYTEPFSNRQLLDALFSDPSNTIALHTKDIACAPFKNLTEEIIQGNIIRVLQRAKELGFDLNKKNQFGNSLLWRAMYSYGRTIVDYLINECNVSQININSEGKNFSDYQ